MVEHRADNAVVEGSIPSPPNDKSGRVISK